MPFDFAIVMKSSDRVAAMSVRKRRTYTGIWPAASTSTGRMLCLMCSTGSWEKLTNSVAGNQCVRLIENTYQRITAITKFGMASKSVGRGADRPVEATVRAVGGNTAIGTDTMAEKRML